MQNALIESYYDYKEALQTADDKMKTDIRRDMADLYNPLLQTGLSALNTGQSQAQPDNVRQAALKASLGYLGAAKDINQTYMACDLLGQALMASGDSATAIINFNLAISSYKEHSPTKPDFLMAYVYFRKAIIERYHFKNNKRALVSLMEGQNFLNILYSKFKLTLSKEDKKSYDNGMLDLIGFELDIYLNDTSLSDEALVRFREVMDLYPEDYDIHISYANLLEKIDMNLAIDAYETAISIDEERPLAYFNLGALYNNLGKDAYIAGLNEDNDPRADSLYNEATVYFRKAYVNMENAYNLNPRFLPTIRALVQLAGTLGLDEQKDFYQRKELEMRGF
jgi:tetratricopeptide (TPR) repeat protein